MEFKDFNELMQAHLASMYIEAPALYEVDVSKDVMWETYLNSFAPEYNKIFRERREYDCSCCRQFIRAFGNVVVIKDGKFISIWDFKVPENCEFYPVVSALSEMVHSATIKGVMFYSDASIGTISNKELTPNGILTWEHLYTKLPQKFVKPAHDIGTISAEVRAKHDVLLNSLHKISIVAVDTVLELIAQNSLYKGIEWKNVLERFRFLLSKSHPMEEYKKDLFCWELVITESGTITNIKNHSIGVLLQDITEEIDLDEAVRKYEAIVAPTNYRRPKAIFTKAMVEKAQQKIEELGLTDSLGRRFAVLADITINNVLFADKDTAKKMKSSAFDELKKEVVDPKKFNAVTRIQIDNFIKDVLPTITSMELLVEGRHRGNLVSLIAPEVSDSKALFKWGNNFSWAYKGNITDSMVELVKTAGGAVDGVLRFSIKWNEDNDNHNDLDAHCVLPNGHEIHFRDKNHKGSKGSLDVDIINPRNKVAIENITFPDKKYMPVGIYKFKVHTYSYHNGNSGFVAEIATDGEITQFEHRKPTRSGEMVDVAEVSFDGKTFVLQKNLPNSGIHICGLTTGEFVPVTTMMLSPNYWDGRGVGNKHYFFMLKGCINEETPNGFFNEFLEGELNQHRKVIEALGSKMKVKESDDQLSGLGFSSTKSNNVFCRVNGNVSRVLKIIF